jgi:hypothetical protein
MGKNIYDLSSGIAKRNVKLRKLEKEFRSGLQSHGSVYDLGSYHRQIRNLKSRRKEYAMNRLKI